MNAAVVLFPGSNREGDVASAIKRITGKAAKIVWHADEDLPSGTDLVVLPGGFSYGDYLRCGAIAARAPIMNAVREHADRGGLVLGICNGFQILCEAQLLPGVLQRNAQLRFMCKEVYLRVERSDTPYTRRYNAGDVLRIPVAHGEGNYTADKETIERLEGDGRVLFRYVSPEGKLDAKWNHNGSTNAIAGVLSEKRNVLGLMPHPENHVDPLIGPTDGRGLFESIKTVLEAA
jgi:phosphoribosylformylglycinamidine synthase